MKPIEIKKIMDNVLDDYNDKKISLKQMEIRMKLLLNLLNEAKKE
jgi:hypothetical protein